MSDGKIRYKIIKSDNLILAHVIGSITFDDMLNYMKELVHHPDYQDGMNSFYDLANCSNIVGEITGLSGLAATLNDQEAIVLPCRTAVVVPDDNEKIFKLAQGLVLMTSQSKIEHRLFKASYKHQAYQFVGLSEQTVAGLED